MRWKDKNVVMKSSSVRRGWDEKMECRIEDENNLTEYQREQNRVTTVWRRQKKTPQEKWGRHPSYWPVSDLDHYSWIFPRGLVFPFQRPCFCSPLTVDCCPQEHNLLFLPFFLLFLIQHNLSASPRSHRGQTFIKPFNYKYLSSVQDLWRSSVTLR